MLFIFISFSFSLGNCALTIEPPKGVTYYEYDLEPKQTICFSSNRYFYVMIHNFKNTVISAHYTKKKDSGTSLKSIYFDSSNCSTISPFIDFGNYFGLVSISASKQATVRLETIVLDVKCQDDITVTNSATDTFVIYPQSSQQCVFPFPKCDILSVNFFPTFPENNGAILVYESPDKLQHTITANYQKDYTKPFYFIINANKTSSDSYVMFTYTGTGCIKGTKRISTQVSTFIQNLRAPLSYAAIIGIIIGSVALVIIASVIIVYCIIKKRHLQEKLESSSKDEVEVEAFSDSSSSSNDFGEQESDYLQNLTTHDSINDEEEFSSDSDFPSVDPTIDKTPSYFYQDEKK